MKNYLTGCPISIGQVLYFCVEGDHTLGCDKAFLAVVDKGTVVNISFNANDSFFFKLDTYGCSEEHLPISHLELGFTVFTTEESANNALYTSP